jgi:hypothetical protein
LCDNIFSITNKDLVKSRNILEDLKKNIENKKQRQLEQERLRQIEQE